MTKFKSNWDSEEEKRMLDYIDLKNKEALQEE